MVAGVDRLQIRMEEGDIGATATNGQGANGYVIEGNFLTYGLSSAQLTKLAKSILEQIGGREYRPAKISCYAMPWLEVGDGVRAITTAVSYTHLFDEVALMPESFVDQATGRCSVDGSKYWFNCNPAGPYHWFKTNWIDRAIGYLGKAEVNRQKKEAEEKKQEISFKRLLYVHFTMDDNLSLSEEIKARYRSLYTGVFFKLYILGLWAMAEGIIYDMFDSARHVIRLAAVEDRLIPGGRYVSCDYGTQNALAFLLWNKGTDGVWYCTREY